MKKLLLFIVIATWVVGVPAYAQPHSNTKSQTRPLTKQEKKQQKAQKKYAKAQRKAERKMLKTEKKNTHYPKHSLGR